MDPHLDSLAHHDWHAMDPHHGSLTHHDWHAMAMTHSLTGLHVDLIEPLTWCHPLATTTLRVWDLDTGVGRATLEGHASWVRSVAISQDGKTLVSGSGDRTVR